MVKFIVVLLVNYSKKNDLPEYNKWCAICQYRPTKIREVACPLPGAGLKIPDKMLVAI